MNLRYIANLIPKKYRFKIKQKINSFRAKLQLKLISKKTPEEFREFLINKLFLKEGVDVIVHTSYEALLYWGLSPKQVINIIRDVIGSEATLVMPTFTKINSIDFINSKETFDVQKTPTQMGFINEIFRRMPGVIRSLDPFKSFAAIGPKADEYTKEHHLSVYSYDKFSPLYKLMENKGIVIGLGVPLNNLTIVHTIENLYGEEFPISVYNSNIYDIRVRTYSGDEIIVKKKNLSDSKPNINIEKYVKAFDSSVVKGFNYNFSPYFYCNANLFVTLGMDLAKKGITIYV